MPTHRSQAFTSPFQNVFKIQLLLWTSLAGSMAYAQEITTETTVPVVTSTFDNGGPSDVTITEDGSILLGGTEGQVAITVDSDNSVTNDGLIQFDDTNNVTAILIDPGLSGDIISSGTILLQEDYTREDDDDDDDLDGPLALGNNRIGIHLQSGGTHTGTIDLQDSSLLTVEGNSSAGILLESMLDGNLIIDGGISVIGEDGVAIDAAEGVTGDVILGSSITTRGANAKGVILDGDVGGNIAITGSVFVSGFTSTGVTNYIPPASLTEDTDPIADRIDAEDINDSGSAVVIGGSVANGLLVNGNVDDFVSQEDVDDETKDTIEDFDENRSSGSVLAVGSAPALLITPDLNGAATDDIIIGTVVETVRDTLDDDEDDDFTETLATFEYERGLINRGTISADGLNIGFDATGLQIEGSADGTFTTQIMGGILNTGTIEGTAFEADATAIDLRSGAIVGSIENDGLISATVSTLEGNTATAIKIAEGAEVTSVLNTGTITARSNGDTGNAAAIQDLNGNLTEITNRGTLSAFLVDNGQDETDLGSAVAIDLTATSQDVTLLQEQETPVEDRNGDDEIDEDDVNTPALVGDILFGSGNDTFTVTSGTVSSDTDFGLGNGTMSLSSATYTGTIFFRDGTNSLTATNTTINGDISFLDDSSTFDLTSSTFNGRLISNGALQSFTAVDSEIELTNNTVATLGSLSITGDSVLQIDLDPREFVDDPLLTVTGMAEIGEGVTIRPVLETITSTDFVKTVIEADDLAFAGTLDDALITDAPFIYNVTLQETEGVTDTLDLEFSLKTSEELGFDLNQAAAYGAVLDVFSSDDDLGAALATITEGDDFYQTYNLLLPQRTEASSRYLAAQGSAIFGALGNRLNAISNSGDRNMGVWAQEFFTHVEIDEDTNVPGYNGSGLGFAFGVDRKLSFIDVIGLYGTYVSGDFEEKTGGNNPVTTSSFGIGLYAKDSVGPIDLMFSGQLGNVDFNSKREFTLDEIPYELEGAWDGTSAIATAGASSQIDVGGLYVRPALSIDYFQLDQDAYTETGDDLLALSIDSAETDRLSATAVMAIGKRFEAGRNGTSYWAPELSVGYRNELSSTPYETTASYLGSEEVFQVLSQETFSDAVLAGLSITSDSSILAARVGYDVEVADEGIIHYGGITLRLKF
ncbi:MAG: autotransporter outer membrane beta-barrel domain-containing protein [Pseudomonadota bacterium]